MKVLFIVGTCLSKNTSANMSHNSYIQGFVENGCDVDVIMQTDSWGQSDSTLKKIDGVNYIEYESKSRIDKLRKRFSRANVKSTATNNSQQKDKKAVDKIRKFKKILIRNIIKKFFFMIFPEDKIYPLDYKWIVNAGKFRSDKVYDLVVSNSTPPASHKLAHTLITNGNVVTHRWIQIWEDPWFHDLYGNRSIDIKHEEEYLLEVASEILYVSPLTTEYQKGYFPSAAHKMSTIALPFFSIEGDENKWPEDEISYGYFGDYYSYTRNILPVFNVLSNSHRRGFIFGDTDLALSSDTVKVSPRVTLDILSKVQKDTTVLIHLSNLRGGQIPGKIYHYSATNKPILFILDGTEEEKAILRQYFGQFNRYYFCENNEDSISSAINKIESDIANGKQEKVIEAFSPKEVIKTIL